MQMVNGVKCEKRKICYKKTLCISRYFLKLRLTTIVKALFYNVGSNILSTRQLDIVEKSLDLLTYFELYLQFWEFIKDQRLKQMCILIYGTGTSILENATQPLLMTGKMSMAFIHTFNLASRLCQVLF